MLDLDERPAPAPASTGGDDTIHIVCCNPDLALCGLDVTGEPYVDQEPSPDDPVCDLCMIAFYEFAGCSAAGCLGRAGEGGAGGG